MSQLASESESATKVKLKDSYDRKTKPKELEMGSIGVPGLVGMLDDSWSGPFEVIDKHSLMTCQYGIPGGLAPQHALKVDYQRCLSSTSNHGR